MTGAFEQPISNPQPLKLRDFLVYKSVLNAAQQAELVSDIRAIASVAPFFTPVMPSGKPMRVRMTSAGQYGWVSDRQGYRYDATHPNGTPWPEIPSKFVDIWRALSGVSRDPESCLINYYGDAAKMGMHQDKDEADFSQPVVSLSLGDDALFRVGNIARGGKTESIWLQSGDIVVMGGEARLRYHGIDRIKFGSSGLLPKGGRINVTLRVVT